MNIPLSPSDTHYLKAALGWIELGNATEAEAELAWIEPSSRLNPDVLEVRWQLDVQRKNWEAALSAARELLKVAPERASGWIHQAYSLRRVEGGGLPAAREALLPALERFPQELVIPYNLACYAAQLGQLDEAWEWLGRARKIGGTATVRKMALNDPDLKPLWDKLRGDWLA